MRKTYQTLNEELNRMKVLMGIINESSNEEAWELVGQEHPVIKNMVQDKGYKFDDESADKLTPIIEKLPTIEVTYDQIKDFQNLENKESDKGLIKSMKEISQTDNPRQGYKDYMDERDKNDIDPNTGQNRKRGYNPVDNFDRIVSNEYEPPVVLEVNDQYYVVGGRTRLYASIAADKPIRIKILKPNDL